MADYVDIGKRIATIILSPESAVSLVKGIASVPLDLSYLAYGFIDTESRYSRELEKERMVRAIRYGILENHNFLKTIEIVLDIFNKYIPEERQDKIYRSTLFSVAGRAITNTVVSGAIAQSIAQRTGLLVGLRGGIVGNALLAGGMAERSIYTSRKLKLYAPELYNALRSKNYDLLYFLVEPAIQPFVDAINVKWSKGFSEFNVIISAVESEIKRRINGR
jgi:hypothetical protein